MKIQIEFDLPEEVIAKASKSACVALFEGPSPYARTTGSLAYESIENAARKAIAEIDWTPVVKAEIARLTPDVVHDVVGAALKAMVKAQVKTMKEAGDLLDTANEERRFTVKQSWIATARARYIERGLSAKAADMAATSLWAECRPEMRGLPEQAVDEDLAEQT